MNYYTASKFIPRWICATIVSIFFPGRMGNQVLKEGDKEFKLIVVGIVSFSKDL